MWKYVGYLCDGSRAKYKCLHASLLILCCDEQSNHFTTPSLDKSKNGSAPPYSNECVNLFLLFLKFWNVFRYKSNNGSAPLNSNEDMCVNLFLFILKILKVDVSYLRIKKISSFIFAFILQIRVHFFIRGW